MVVLPFLQALASVPVPVKEPGSGTGCTGGFGTSSGTGGKLGSVGS